MSATLDWRNYVMRNNRSFIYYFCSSSLCMCTVHNAYCAGENVKLLHTHTHTSAWVSPDSSRMLVGATVAAAVSLLGYSGFSNSRLQMLETQQRGAACKPAYKDFQNTQYDKSFNTYQPTQNKFKNTDWRLCLIACGAMKSTPNSVFYFLWENI